MRKQAGSLDCGDLHLGIQVAQQECDLGTRRFVADLLHCDQRFVKHVGILGAQRLDEIGHRRLAAQNSHRTRGIGARLHAGAAAHQRADRGDDVGTRRDILVHHLVVGIGEFALDAAAHALDGGAEAGLHVAGKVEVDQAIGGLDLDFGIVIVRRQDQGVQRPRAGQLLDGLDTHVDAGVLQEFRQPRNRRAAGLADLANVLGPDVLGGGGGDQGEGHKIEAHVRIIS